MLHELIDFSFFICPLPCHGLHELLHPGDIGLGDIAGSVITHLLPVGIHDALIIE